MISSPPPPPADPPLTSQHQRQLHRPTFIEQWLVDEENRKKTHIISSEKTKKNSNINKREYFERQCLFPRHIPQSAMCNIESMLYVISGFHAVINNNDITNNIGGATTPSTTTTTTTCAAAATATKTLAWNDIRQIASHCATYKSRAEQNHIEFQYKRAMKIRQQKTQQQEQQEESTTSSTKNIEKNKLLDPSLTNIILPSTTTHAHSTTSTTPTNDPPPPPQPFHPEYTPLTLPENFLLSKIHSANYNICLAHTSCPQLSSHLLSCWKQCDPTWVQYMQQHGLEQFICMEERMAVERCVGRRVENAMKDILLG